MAVSDYVQITFNKNGALVKDNEFEIEKRRFLPYKTWLYILQKGSDRAEYTFYEGSILCDGVSICGKIVRIKNSQEILYGRVLVWLVEYSGKKPETYCGVCASGYLNWDRTIAIQNGVKENWDIVRSSCDGITTIECSPPFDWKNASKKDWDEHFKQRIIIDVSDRKDQLIEYCGITQDMINALVTFLVENEKYELAAKIGKKKSLTYQNQGDRFFGGQKNIVGKKPKIPVIMQMLGKK